MAKNKRTTAQRRAAAKEAWRLRRLKSANAPTPVKRTADKLPVVDIRDLGAEAGLEPIRHVASFDPTTAGCTKEGADFYVTITSGGHLHRHRLSAGAVRKLGLDCLQLVG